MLRQLSNYAALSFILLASCQNDDVLHPKIECDLDCAEDEFGNVVVSDDAKKITCHTGKTVCLYENNSVIIKCENFQLPTIEVCDKNNLDEDCNGLSNEVVYEWYESSNNCISEGECRYSTAFCMPDGSLYCVYQSLLYGQELCDGVDNDCDGLIDADDPDLVYEDSTFEYSGPENTLNVGECRAGVRRCSDGKEYLFGEVLPTTEVCGNDDDDDCDGLTDEDESPLQTEAFALFIDYSGSMAGIIASVRDALCNWSVNGNFTNSYFAVIAVAASYQNDPFIDIVTDFTSAIEACDDITTFTEENGLNGGSEYVPYAIWGINNDPNLILSWPENTRRRVVFFSDEYPQGYLNSSDIEINSVAQDCVLNNYSVGGFAIMGVPEWRTMTDPCQGWVEFLYDDPTYMSERLAYRFGSECGANSN